MLMYPQKDFFIPFFPLSTQADGLHVRRVVLNFAKRNAPESLSFT